MDALYWPFVIYFLAAMCLVAGMIVISYFLGERHEERVTGEPYESGVLPTGTARLRFSIKFYLVAMFFVIFDVESIFIFAWAIAFQDLGWVAYIEMLVFIGILISALIYLWRVGALDWGTAPKKAKGIARKQEI